MSDFSVLGIIKEGAVRGLKNFVAIVVNVILWALTIWIPYLNVGTTIGLFAGLIIKMKNGESISMTEIFNPAYRKRMGELFLTSSFVGMGAGLGMVFLVVPGVVISLAWSLAGYLVLEKEQDPMEAISKSNSLTYGKKWTIFGGLALLFIASGALAYVFSLLGTVGAILSLVLALLLVPIMMGAQSFIYGSLSK